MLKRDGGIYRWGGERRRWAAGELRKRVEGYSSEPPVLFPKARLPVTKRLSVDEEEYDWEAIKINATPW